ncbi:hypothetical protein ACWEQL_34845 [Kitasatospora sp. NPDC004240]
MSATGDEQPVSDDHINPRLAADVHMELVDAPPQYTRTTDGPVEYYVTFFEDRYPTGLIWFRDEDDAAGYEWWRELPNENAAIFWNEKLWRAKARGLKPSEAIRDLMAEPGTQLSGRIVPGSRAVAPSLAWLADLAEHGTPLGEASRPDGWRPDPPFGPAQAEAARTSGGWVYQVDEGHDPAGRVPGHAVAGAWQTDPEGRVLRFWHNPLHGAAPEPVTAPLLPLGAGRRPAGRALLDWLEDPRAPRLCRIGGSSGSGRTHLLAWLAAACPPDNRNPDRRVHAVLSADGLTVRSATWRLAALLGVLARTPDDLVGVLQDGIPRTVVVTGLDGAGDDLLAGAPERIAAELLAPLARIPWLRLVVECASGSPAAAALYAADPRAAVLDLDDPRWTDPARFAEWCARLDGAPVDAERVYPSPGLALLAARTPSLGPVDPFAIAGGGGSSAEAVGLAAAWWNALPEDERATVRALNEAGRPLSLATWAALPGAGGLETVRRAAARLLPPPEGHFADGAQALWRPAPRQLAARVAADRPATDHTALVLGIIATVPLRDDGRPDFDRADPAALGVLMRHVVRAGFAGDLLANPILQAHAEAADVTAAFEHNRATVRPDGDSGIAPFAEAWDLAGPACAAATTPAERAAALHAHLGGRVQHAADLLTYVSRQGWWATWSHRTGQAQVRGIVAGHGPYAGRLGVATDRELRFLEPRSGTPAEGLAPLPLPEGYPARLLVADDGALVMLGRDGAVTAVAAPGTLPIHLPPVGARRPSRTVEGEVPVHHLAVQLDFLARRTSSGLTAAAFAEGADGQVLAVGDDAGNVTHILTTGGRLYTEPLHRGRVTALDLTPTTGGLLQISGGADGTIWHWYHSGLRPTCVDTRPGAVTAVAATDTPDGVLTAAAWADGLVRLYRPGTGSPVDLNLGRPVHGLTATPDGRIHAAFPEAVIALLLA